MNLKVTRRPEILSSDDKRVIPRYLNFSPERIQRIVERVLEIPEAEVETNLKRVQTRFSSRHRDLEAAFMENYQTISRHARKCRKLPPLRQKLLGAYFTLEYAIESAALFNPSIVPHPDQSNLQEGELRFLMSLRATGEGHISSIVFKRGVIHADGHLTFDPPPRYAHSAKPQTDKESSFRHLESVLRECRESLRDPNAFRQMADRVLWMLTADYRLSFPKDCMPAEIVIFPATPHEIKGMEDLRLVRLVEDDGSIRYLGTYTAYDGKVTYPMMMSTTDFADFHIAPVQGKYARNKGMAIFPRQINGNYYSISRHDGENLFVLKSHDLLTWNQSRKILAPEEDWELVQLGNCGSPIETEAGWILITHGVGPMREYSIGAALLDLQNPAKVIGRLREPLMTATETEREGYVPNVVYSCGSLIHNGQLIIPYAMSDSRTAFATVKVDELIASLQSNGA